MNTLSNNKRIAKNTLFLYLRMFVLMGVSLYTSRVILQQLGIKDFGIYNLVGGIVSLMSFLNTSMAGATSRFLTFDLGTNELEHLKRTFSSAFQIHILIACIILVVGEVAGVWFINTYLNIPNERIYAANIVFQMSLLTSLVSIIQTPYSASLIANEKMDVYAILEIINICLRLAVVYLLMVISYDKLIVYSILVFFIAILVFNSYRIYCTRRFKECVLLKEVHTNIIKPMLLFSGWDLYGNGCVVLRQQGTNILLNQFFGVSLNAASGVATQVSSAISTFVSNITMSVRPQIIKRYASNEILGMQKLLSFALIICLILIELVMLPVYLKIEVIMNLWLCDVPPYAVNFTRLMLIANAISVANTLFNAVIHASGKIKKLSIVTGSLFLLTLPISYIAFIFCKQPELTYMIWVVIMTVALIISVSIVKTNIPKVSLLSLLKNIALPLLSIIMSVIIMSYLSPFIGSSIYDIIILFIVNALLLIAILYLIWIIPLFKGNIELVFKSF